MAKSVPPATANQSFGVMDMETQSGYINPREDSLESQLEAMMDADEAIAAQQVPKRRRVLPGSGGPTQYADQVLETKNQLGAPDRQDAAADKASEAENAAALERLRQLAALARQVAADKAAEAEKAAADKREGAGSNGPTSCGRQSRKS